MRENLELALNRVEQICRQMQDLRALETVEARKEILRLRKEMNGAMAGLEKAAGTTRDDDPATEFISRLAAVRRALALHQTTWPAVSLDRRTDEYLASADKVRRDIAELLRWVRARLK